MQETGTDHGTGRMKNKVLRNFYCCLVATHVRFFGDAMECSFPTSSVHEISQARILEWLPFPSPGDLPNLETESSSHALAGRNLYL